MLDLDDVPHVPRGEGPEVGVEPRCATGSRLDRPSSATGSRTEPAIASGWKMRSTSRAFFRTPILCSSGDWRRSGSTRTMLERVRGKFPEQAAHIQHVIDDIQQSPLWQAIATD